MPSFFKKCICLTLLLITSTSWGNSFSYLLPQKQGSQFHNNQHLFPSGVTINPSGNGSTFSIGTAKKTNDLNITVGKAVTGAPLSVSVSNRVNSQFQDLTVTTANDGIISITDCQGQIESNKVQDLRCVVASRTICEKIAEQKLSLLKSTKSDSERQQKINDCQQLSSEYSQVLKAVNQAYDNRSIEKQVKEFYQRDSAQLDTRIEKMGLSPDSKFFGLISNKPTTTSDPDTNLGLIRKFEDTFKDMRAVNRLFDICEKQPKFTEQGRASAPQNQRPGTAGAQ